MLKLFLISIFHLLVFSSFGFAQFKGNSKTKVSADRMLGDFSLKESVTIRERTCFEPWLRDLESPEPDIAAVKKSFKEALLCTDPCITSKDATYYTENCYDWLSILKLKSQNTTSLHDALDTVLNSKLVQCSLDKIASAKQTKVLDGVFFDPNKNRCFDLKGDDYVSFFKRTLRFALGYVHKYGNNNDYIEKNLPGFTAEISGDINYRTPEILFDLKYKVNLDASMDNKKQAGSSEDSLRKQPDFRAKLEAGMYKIFGKSYCNLFLGPKVSGTANTQAVDGIHYKQLEAAAQGSVGMICSGADVVWSVFALGDVFRITAFEVKNESLQQLVLFSYPGRQWELGTKWNIKNFSFYFLLGRTSYEVRNIESPDIISTQIRAGADYKYPFTISQKSAGLYFGTDIEMDSYEIDIPKLKKQVGWDFTGQLISGVYF